MSYLKNNFNGGEVGAALRYRADLAKYANCEELLENFFVLPQGGVENRPGTKVVKRETLPSADSWRLIPFQFSNTERFALLFRDRTIEVLGAGVTVASPYAAADDPGLIRCTQKNDVLFLAHPKHAPRMLKRYSDADWRLEVFSPVGGPWQDIGNENDITMAADAVSGTGVTVTASADVFTADMVGSKLRLLHVREENGFTHKFSGDADISSTKRVSIFGNWKFRSDGSWIGTLKLLRSTDNGASWETFRSYVANADDNADDGDYEKEMNVLYSCRFEGWQKPPAGVLYECRVTLTHEDYSAQGDGTITDVTDARHAVVTVNHDFYSTAPAKEWSFDSWNEHQGYPALVGFYSGDRLVFGRTEGEMQTLWFSAVGDYVNFTPGTLAENAIALTLNTGRYNAIRWLCEMGDKLYLGCANGVMRVMSADSDAPLAPGKVRVVPSGVTGTADLPALAAGEAILFVRRGSRALMEFSYQYSDDVYRTPEMSILNPDILDAGVREIHLRQSPYPMLLCLRTDGVLCCFTYNRSEEVMAWSRFTAADGGRIASLCVLDTDAKEDEVYLVVERFDADGNVRLRSVEKLMPRVDDSAGAGCYLDCAAERNSDTPADTFSVLELAGETVTVNADGVILRDVAVSAEGALTLPQHARHIWAGLEYVSTMRTLPLEAAQHVQGTLSQTKRIPEVILKFRRTFGGDAAVLSSGERRELAARRFTAALDAPVDEETRDLALVMFNAPAREQQIEVRQTLPLPMTLLALVAETE